ncbi:MAG: AEC family transporter [Gammaproteobacteria bacterium]|nr:AEC family transporter [Gammaproteobacteria bacterium]
MYAQLIPILAPVFIITLVGYGWARLGLTFQRDFLTGLVMNIGVPCLILNGTTHLETGAALFLSMMGFAVLALVSCAVVGSLVLRLLDQPLRSYLPPVAFGNAGNLGLPLCLFAFGKQGLGLAIGFYLVGSVSQFLVGPLFQGRKPVWRTLLATPVNYAVVLGVGLLATDTTLPLWVSNTVELLAGIAIPLMMLALGHALGSFKVQRLPIAAAIAAGRLGLGLAVGLIIAQVFGLTGIERGVVLVQSAMPVAVFNFLLAARYDRHPDDIAGAIVISTLVSFATLPVLLLLALPAAQLP